MEFYVRPTILSNGLKILTRVQSIRPLRANSQAGYRLHLSVPWRGKGAAGERETERKGGGRCMGGGRRGGGKRILKVAGSGRKGNNYATLRNISQSKKCKEAGANM